MSATHESRNIFIEGPAGRLEAIFWKPVATREPAVAAGKPALAAVVCHPHPLFGGTMHNKVIYQVAKTLDALGVPVLRFNFRGTGLSEGHHDRGRGERGDVTAAIDFVAGEFPGTPVLVAGFSFGSVVGLRVGCEDERVIELVGLGVPVNDSDFSFLAECGKPKLFVHGEKDEHGAVGKVKELVESLPGENRLVVVAGAEHFFAGKLDEVDRAIREWVVGRHAELSG
ncbi:MAG TPA: alpha/beta family hydrolase [Candidatus Acidoferrum sp.]|jgi:hypothetical protein